MTSVTNTASKPPSYGTPMSPLPELVIPRLARLPDATDGFDAALWSQVPVTAVASFHSRSTQHRPLVKVRVASTVEALHLVWRVVDRYVLSRVTEENGTVCWDSCVECFISPLSDRGYVNIEVNAGGVALASHVTSIAPFACRAFSSSEMRLIGRRGSLEARIDPEIPHPCVWDMAVTIPFDLLSDVYGVTVAPVGTWRANLYKCADQCSHPHWASWSPIGDTLSFHQPEHFGVWRFA